MTPRGLGDLRSGSTTHREPKMADPVRVLRELKRLKKVVTAIAAKLEVEVSDDAEVDSEAGAGEEKADIKTPVRKRVRSDMLDQKLQTLGVSGAHSSASQLEISMQECVKGEMSSCLKAVSRCGRQ